MFWWKILIYSTSCWCHVLGNQMLECKNTWEASLNNHIKYKWLRDWVLAVWDSGWRGWRSHHFSTSLSCFIQTLIKKKKKGLSCLPLILVSMCAECEQKIQRKLSLTSYVESISCNISIQFREVERMLNLEAMPHLQQRCSLRARNLNLTQYSCPRENWLPNAWQWDLTRCLFV